jgi:hypothetical protein
LIQESYARSIEARKAMAELPSEEPRAAGLEAMPKKMRGHDFFATTVSPSCLSTRMARFDRSSFRSSSARLGGDVKATSESSDSARSVEGRWKKASPRTIACDGGSDDRSLFRSTCVPACPPGDTPLLVHQVRPATSPSAAAGGSFGDV